VSSPAAPKEAEDHNLICPKEGQNVHIPALMLCEVIKASQSHHRCVIACACCVSQAAILSDPISAEDMAGALANTRRSAHFKADKYQAWEREFGAT
jgi:hypothetical protein